MQNSEREVRFFFNILHLTFNIKFVGAKGKGVTMKLLGRGLFLMVIFALGSCGLNCGNIETYAIRRDDCTKFVVVKQGFDYPLAYVDRENKLHLIRGELGCLGEIWEIIPAPDQSKVVIISYGEGAQSVDIYEVEELIKDDENPSREVKSFTTLDPWPGQISRVHWVDNQRIEFVSEVDFRGIDRKNRRGICEVENVGSKAAEKKWQWDIQRDTVRLVADK